MVTKKYLQTRSLRELKSEAKVLENNIFVLGRFVEKDVISLVKIDKELKRREKNNS